MRRYSPIPIELAQTEEAGACAQGFVVARRDLPALAARLGHRARRYAPLRLSLSASEAVFWSAEPCELPWVTAATTYLATPKQRVFMPIGWRYTAPPLFHDAVLSEVPLRGEKGTPLVLLPIDPTAQSSPIRVLELVDSVSVAAADWAALGKGGV